MKLEANPVCLIISFYPTEPRTFSSFQHCGSYLPEVCDLT